MFVGYSGLLNERLPPAGARFVQRFARSQPGVTIESFAVAAAQATDVMLDAIARSDGTRASVVRQLFSTRIEHGELGRIRFDARGDLRAAPVTILRVVGGGTVASIAGAGGTAVERVELVGPELVASGPEG
jgi:ABC-type branched-subunit amino acid transport system substrate-binding protein